MNDIEGILKPDVYGGRITMYGSKTVPAKVIVYLSYSC